MSDSGSVSGLRAAPGFSFRMCARSARHREVDECVPGVGFAMGNGNSRPPPSPPALPPAPYTHQLLNVGAHCASTAVSAGVGFDAAGCMQQAANHTDEAVRAAMVEWPGLCFSLASASGACYV